MNNTIARYQHFIDGRFADPDSGKWFDSYNPYKGEVWAHIAEGNPADVDRAVRAAHDAYSHSPSAALTASQRGALLRKLGALVEREADRRAEDGGRDNGRALAGRAGQRQ